MQCFRFDLFFVLFLFFFILGEMLLLLLLFFCVFWVLSLDNNVEDWINDSHNAVERRFFPARFLVPIGIFGFDFVFIFGSRRVENRFQGIDLSMSWPKRWNGLSCQSRSNNDKTNEIWYWNRNYSNSHTCEIRSKIINLHTYPAKWEYISMT